MSDEAIKKNILAIQAYSVETRAQLRKLEGAFVQIDALRLELEMVKKQLQALFGRL